MGWHPVPKPPHGILCISAARNLFVTGRHNQKTCVRGELIGYGRSGTLHACPACTLVELKIMMRMANGSATTPLYSFRPVGGCILHHLMTTAFTEALRAQARLHGEKFSVHEKEISVHSFPNAGTMALFCDDIKTDRIILIGR